MLFTVSERWIKESELALERIRKQSATEPKDRLERVKNIKTMLRIMGRSLSGWTRWINNPATMTSFSEDELQQMESHLSKVAESFIQYDIEAVKLGQEKGLKRRIRLINLRLFFSIIYLACNGKK